VLVLLAGLHHTSAQGTAFTYQGRLSDGGQPITSTPVAIFENTASNLLGTISASQIGGTIPLAQLPPRIITNGASGGNITGTFSGDGAGVTNVNLGLNSGGGLTFWPGISLLLVTA
jgi:hypothetical protein